MTDSQILNIIDSLPPDLKADFLSFIQFLKDNEDTEGLPRVSLGINLP